MSAMPWCRLATSSRPTRASRIPGAVRWCSRRGGTPDTMMASAGILAGGQARRFDGRDKGALAIDGRTILERQVAELSTIADEILLVGAKAPQLAVRPVDDLVPGCGPLGGVHAAIAH